MTLSSWEHLQNVLMQVQNVRVREEFRDVEAGDDNITTPRSSLRAACLLKDADSALITLMRLWLFEVSLGRAAAFQGPVYGIPVTSFQESRRFKPQIQLYFQEDERDVEQGFSPVTGEITFRLMNEQPDTLTEGELRGFASRVQTTFAAGAGFTWQKGRVMFAYTDRSRGYQLQILCRSAAEGRRITEAVLDIQGHTPDWKHANVSENQEAATAFPIVPPNEVILGRSRRGARSRPVASVRFKYAAAHIHGLPNPIILVDRSRSFPNALIRA